MTTAWEAVRILEDSATVASMRRIASSINMHRSISVRHLIERIGQLSDAEVALARFDLSSAPGVWPHLSKSALIADMWAIIADPLRVRQSGTPLCGPAAIVYELAARNPRRYVEICRVLYETGSFQARMKEVTPSSTLRASPADGGASPANWLLLAALRDTENLIFPVEDDMPDYVGITTPWEMKGWAFEILGYNHLAFESTAVFGEFDAMRAAHRARDAGGVAFLLIHSALLGNEHPVVAYPDHWISFLGNLHIDNGYPLVLDSGRISFDCYTWGSQRHVDTDEGTFEDYMWGVVTATP